MSEFMNNYVMDFNDVLPNENELIPAGTIVKVSLTIRNGGYGHDQTLTKSRGTGALYLNTMLLVVEGDYMLRKIYHRFGIQGYEPGNKWVEKGLGQLRAILESAHNILSTDNSETAREKRKIKSYMDFDKLKFLIKVGIEKPQNPQYKTGNCVQCIVTPDFPEYKA